MTSKNQTIAKERKARTTVRRLLLEGLQSRLLMAGDVSAVIDNGYLVVRGDDAANEITIQGIGGNQIQVTGATGTTINGLTQPAILRLRKGVDIDMKGGDDKLTVIGVNAFGRYQIRMELGAANDTLVADGLFAQRIHANGGDGNDSITVRNSRSWKGSGVGGGAGDDTLVLQNLRYGNGSCIDGGTGKNTVTETNNRYGARFTKQNVDSSTVVDPPTTPPVASNDTATVVVGQSISVGVLTNDTSSGNSLDPKTVAIATQPSSGTVAVNSATGVITYTHNGGAARTDSFTYTVKDNKGTISNSATVNITKIGRAHV